MRKHVAILAALLVALMCAVSLLPAGLLTEDTLIPDRVAAEDGAVITADNQLLTSRIFWLRDDSITGAYRESRFQNGAASAIRLLDRKGNQVYFVRSYEDDRNTFELFRLDGEVPVSLCSGSLPEGTAPTGLTVTDEGSWLTAVDSIGQILVYDCVTGASGDAASSLRSVLPALGGLDPLRARFDGTNTEVWARQGDHYRLLADGSVEMIGLEELSTPVPELNFLGWLNCKSTALVVGLAAWAVLVLIYLATLFTVKQARTLASRVTAIMGGCVVTAALAVGVVSLYVILEGAGVAAFWNALWWLLPGGAVVTLAALLLTWLVIRRATRAVPDMTRQMAQVSEGRFSPRNVDDGRDELCEMDRNLQEMCMSLSIRDYEVNSTIQSYSRFVPQQLSHLLDRANLAEVCMGDNKSLVENVGVFSVGNRDQVRTMLPDENFVRFINHSFSSLYQCVNESRGVLLSGGLQLSAMQAMFPQDPGDGVRAGLDFLGRTENQEMEDCPAPRLFVLLHKASFLYGLAGQEERLFPYVSSSELDFLNSFSQKLYETGARIVVTEDYWNQLEGFTGRYIGFLSDEEKGTAYKLFEILDSYPEMERNLRIRYDDRFQEALNLYYHNDFYLARNMFSALLRDCPGDGIARWYLFACEYYFNRVEDGTANYSLFGIDA